MPRRAGCDDALSRTILYGGAGNFAAANVMLAHGFRAGAGEGAADVVISH